MGIRLRKTINVGGGLKVNLSKSGIGYSIGTKGYRVTKTAKGTIRKTASIPGTGISYIKETSAKKNVHDEAKASAPVVFSESEDLRKKPALVESAEFIDNVTTMPVVDSFKVQQTENPAPDTSEFISYQPSQESEAQAEAYEKQKDRRRSRKILALIGIGIGLLILFANR